MVVSPVTFVVIFLTIAIGGWLVSRFFFQGVAFVLAALTGISVTYRVLGLFRIKDITLEFKKGKVESIYIREVKINLSQPKLHKVWHTYATSIFSIIIRDLEVILRTKVSGGVRNAKKRPSGTRSSRMTRLLVQLARLFRVDATGCTLWTQEVPGIAFHLHHLAFDAEYLYRTLKLSVEITNCQLYVISMLNKVGNRGLRYLSVPIAEQDDNDTLPLFQLGSLCAATTLGKSREGRWLLQSASIDFGHALMNLNEELLNLHPDKPDARSETIVESSATIPPTAEDSLGPLQRLKNPWIPEMLIVKLASFEISCRHEKLAVGFEGKLNEIIVRLDRTDDLETCCLDASSKCTGFQIGQYESTGVEGKIATRVNCIIPSNAMLPIEIEAQLDILNVQCKMNFEDILFLGKVLMDSRSKVTKKNQQPTLPKVKKKSKLFWKCGITNNTSRIFAHGLEDVSYKVDWVASYIFIEKGSGGCPVEAQGELRALRLSTSASESHTGDNDELKIYEKVLYIERTAVEWGLAALDERDEAELGDGSVRQGVTLQLGVIGGEIMLNIPLIEKMWGHGVTLKDRLKEIKGQVAKESVQSPLESRKPNKFQRVKLALEAVAFNISQELEIVVGAISDPKRVNFDCQGGEVIFAENPDGNRRTASISLAEHKGRKYGQIFCAGLIEASRLIVTADLQERTVRAKVERLRTVYFERNLNGELIEKISVTSLSAAWIVYRKGSATDVRPTNLLLTLQGLTGRWEPDIQLFVDQLQASVKKLLQKRKSLRQMQDLPSGKSPLVGNKSSDAPGLKSAVKHKLNLCVSVDLEDFQLSAILADGVEGFLHVKSLFSEEAQVGVLLEQVRAGFNGATVLCSDSLQISRVVTKLSGAANSGHGPGKDSIPEGLELQATTLPLEVFVQGVGTRIIVPYRLELRAIEDAIEEMRRALKLVRMSQKAHNDAGVPAGKTRQRDSVSKGVIRLSLRRFAIEIEEQPMQGWLDHHFHLLERERRKLRVQEQLLELRLTQAGSMSDNSAKSGLRDNLQRSSTSFSSASFDLKDSSGGRISGVAAKKIAWEELQLQCMRSYKAACDSIHVDKGSGSAASNTGQEAGFVFSSTRRSLMSLALEAAEISLYPIQGGRDGMIQKLRTLDEVNHDLEIPISRIYGRQVELSGTHICWKLRDYTLPLVSSAGVTVSGAAIFAAQATVFQPQQRLNVYIGRWRKVSLWRSLSGTTPPLKFYHDISIQLHNGVVSYGVGYEPPLYGDVSYAISVAIKKSVLSERLREGALSNPTVTPGLQVHESDSGAAENSEDVFFQPVQPLPKERSLPWWDLMRYYVHGHTRVTMDRFQWYFLATTDPYERENVLHLEGTKLILTQQKGNVLIHCDNILATLPKFLDKSQSNSTSSSSGPRAPTIHSPIFQFEVASDWECDSSEPNMHYLHALPREGRIRSKLYDPFRSKGLNVSVNWRFLASFDSDQNVQEDVVTPTDWSGHSIPGQDMGESSFSDSVNAAAEPEPLHVVTVPTFRFGARDLAWIVSFYKLMYYSSHKLRSFGSRKRFGVPKRARSGNMSLSRTLSEMLVRVAISPGMVNHLPTSSEDPAKGLRYIMERFKYEFCWSRNLKAWDGTGKRPSFITAYQGLDISSLRFFLDDASTAEEAKADCPHQFSQTDHLRKLLELSGRSLASDSSIGGLKEVDRGFLMSTNSVLLRKQSPLANLDQLASWHVSGQQRTKPSRIPGPSGSEREDFAEVEDWLSDTSDEEGLAVVADNSWRVLIHELRLLWNIPNRDAAWAWIEDMSKAFAAKKPSPSRQWATRKKAEEMKNSDSAKDEAVSPAPISGVDPNGGEEASTKFLITIIQPQFNLHSEEAHGRFLLAAASGRILARSLMSIVHEGSEFISQLRAHASPSEYGESGPTMTWKRREISVMLEHVQAHVAPTDIDPAARIQWLPHISKSGASTPTSEAFRSGNLLQQVFAPCTMYFQYNRHKGGRSDSKVKPLKEISFNSPSILAAMTGPQFQILLDVIWNLLLGQQPKMKKSKQALEAGEEEEVEEEAHEVVPDDIEEVEMAKIEMERLERECTSLVQELHAFQRENYDDSGPSQGIPESTLWQGRAGREHLWITATCSLLAIALEEELKIKREEVKNARAKVRRALQAASKQEQAKQKSPSSAVAIAWKLDKGAWSFLDDGKPFAEAAMSNMVLHLDRDFDNVAIANFSIKEFSLVNWMPKSKSKMLLTAWHSPGTLNRKAMLTVVGRHAAAVDGVSRIEAFEVDVCPLRVHVTDAITRKMWDYFFPKEDGSDQIRQEALGPHIPPPLATAEGECSKQNSWPLESAGEASSVSSSPSERLGRANSEPMPEPSKSISTGGSDSPRDLPPSGPLAQEDLDLSRTSSLPAIARNGPIDTIRSLYSRSLPKHPRVGSSPAEKRNPVSSKKEQIADKSAKDSPSSVADEKETLAPPTKKVLYIQNIEISQVELIITYQGGYITLSDVRILLDTFSRTEFVGSWRKLFSKVKKHVVWGVLKSVAGMQSGKYKDQLPRPSSYSSNASSFDSDSDAAEPSSLGMHLPSIPGGPGSVLLKHIKKQTDRAGEHFVTSVRGLFSSQKRRARSILMRSAIHDFLPSPRAAFGPGMELLPLSKSQQREGGSFKAKAFRKRRHGDGDASVGDGSIRGGQHFPLREREGSLARAKTFLTRRMMDALDSDILQAHGEQGPGLIADDANLRPKAVALDASSARSNASSTLGSADGKGQSQKMAEGSHGSSGSESDGSPDDAFSDSQEML